MNRRFEWNVVLFFIVLTVLMTIGVILLWEEFLRPPFFAWVEALYPGTIYAQLRWDVQQRVEHFFISFMVDALVVTLLLRLVHRQQRKLRQSEELYRALFEQARDGIGLVRIVDHRLVEANDKFCEILGLRQHDCVGLDVRELLRANTPNAQPELTTVAPNGHVSGDSELIIRTARGRSQPVSVSFTPLSTDGEKVMIMVLRDLSMRKQLEAEREEMQRQLYQSSKLASIGELSAGVAHEINNPLNGIINFAQLLKDEERPRSEFEQQMIDGIINEGGRIAQIVRGLLTFARSCVAAVIELFLLTSNAHVVPWHQPTSASALLISCRKSDRLLPRRRSTIPQPPPDRFACQPISLDHRLTINLASCRQHRGIRSVICVKGDQRGIRSGCFAEFTVGAGHSRRRDHMSI
jgi:PAS domain S-box-containing protein